MTRQSKKEHERRQASRFLKDFEHSSIEDSERPDFRVRRPAGDFALEVTEYHSQASQGATGRPRVAVEATWWRYLEPLVAQERKTQSQKYVKIHLRFVDSRLPTSAECPALARELVGAVGAAFGHVLFDVEATVEFVLRAQVKAFANIPDGETIFLPSEDWPNVAQRLEYLIIRRHLAEWPSWDCQNATSSFVGPDPAELDRILHHKADAAKSYDLAGLPLWLLRTCPGMSSKFSVN